MSQNSLFPAAIISQSESQQLDVSSFQFNIDKQSFATTQEYVHYLTHEVMNKTHKDGRIYFSMKDGILCANSVSPYARQFWSNIEMGILPVVKALHNKRYLTYSSCEGHGMDFRRYVGLAFCDEESREKVAKYVMDLGIKGVKVKKFNSVANNSVVEHDATGKPTPTKSLMIEKERTPEDLQNEVMSFNVQFHRNYDSYYFLEIIIFDEISYNYEGFFKEIKKVLSRYMKKKYQDKSTLLLAFSLQDDDFKKYSF